MPSSLIWAPCNPATKTAPPGSATTKALLKSHNPLKKPHNTQRFVFMYDTQRREHTLYNMYVSYRQTTNTIPPCAPPTTHVYMYAANTRCIHIVLQNASNTTFHKSLPLQLHTPVAACDVQPLLTTHICTLSTFEYRLHNCTETKLTIVHVGASGWQYTTSKCVQARTQPVLPCWAALFD